MTYSILDRKTVAEFFAGIGLMRMGLEQAGWSVIFANDIDPKKYNMYKAQFSDAEHHFALGDIYDLSGAEIPPVTLATASFPCIDLSLAGPMNGLKGRLLEERQQGSGAFWGFIQLIREMHEKRPPFILLENVTSFLTSHGGEDFRAAVAVLNDLGYLADAFILDAVSFVPQSRKRMFLVGIHSSIIPPETSVQVLPTQRPYRPQALVRFIQAHPELRWMTRDFPMPLANMQRLEDIVEPDETADSRWWPSNRVEKLIGQMSPRHLGELQRMMSQDRWSYATAFRRTRAVRSEEGPVKRSMAELRTDGVAGCLRTPKGGSAKQILVSAGYGQCRVRLVSSREAARLMGAGNFKIEVSLDDALFGFGDAVCVPVIEWITRHYFNPLVNEITQGEMASIGTVRMNI